MIGVVSYGMGNLQSVLNAFEALGEQVSIISQPRDVADASAIVIPGVGAFGDGMRNLREAGLIEPLHKAIVESKKPFLGVCLGMQLIALKSFEHGEHSGLGWVDFAVERIVPGEGLRVPHMGWNELQEIQQKSPLFKEIEEPAVAYFVHSYHLVPLAGSESSVTSKTIHGKPLTATIQKDNIFGTQFHPEKSQHTGLKILKNFIDIAHEAC